jgi:hypothetical protein
MLKAYSLVVVAVASVLCAPHAGIAAEGTEAQRKACEPDAMRLCKDAVPDHEKIKACLQANLDRLSADCRAVLAERSD